MAWSLVVKAVDSVRASRRSWSSIVISASSASDSMVASVT